MKRLFFLIVFLPFAAFAQRTVVKKPGTNIKPGIPKTQVKVVKESIPVKPVDGYLVYGTVTGFADGTEVSFYNEQTGSLDEQAKIIKNKFSFSGKVQQPELKQLYFGQTQPIQLFLDNSAIEITMDASMPAKTTISGSPTHKLFGDLQNQIGPLQQALTNEGDVYDVATRNNLTTSLTNFIQQHPSSYVSPVALVILNNTAPEKEALIAQLYNSLDQNIRFTPYANYVAQQIQAAKRIPIGVELPNFTQTDSTGNPVALTSFRGKYLLVDFWASWCRPCRQENPNVVAAFNQYNSKNFTVLGVSFDQAKPAWINAIAQDGLNWNHVSDLKGWGNAVGAQFGIQSIPQNLLLDPQGKVIGKNLRGKDLLRKLNSLLN
ncbi:MAG: TlpA disulfide reductase family protein [Ferruginibacter sp.]